MFQQIQWLHKQKLLRMHDEQSFEDEGPVALNFASQWAILVDKGYQGGQDIILCIHATEKPKITCSVLLDWQKIGTYRLKGSLLRMFSYACAQFGTLFVRN